MRLQRHSITLALRCSALVLLALLCATPPLHAAEVVLDAEAVRHLLARTGFGPSADEIAPYVGLTRAQAVDRLLGATRTEPVTPPPGWTAEGGGLRPLNGPLATDSDRKAFQREQVRRTNELRAWWMTEMIATPSPLTERMTLFWHNHFVSSQQKVRAASLMYEQNAMFRANALGDFRTLLHAAARGPAMVIYLDGAQNRKAAPNENFAREVMELFTLGEGRYGEGDIKEAARAFTGWSVDRDTGGFVFRRGQHDYGSKTIFGRSGDFDGDAVLDLLLARRETAEFIVAKLWREFVSPEPDAAEVARIAGAFRSANYDVKVALRGLLGSDAFWDAANRGSLVKSPVEIVAGTLRSLALRPDNLLPFAQAAGGMGQVLFAPPNVKGWPGGTAWINTDTLLARKQFLARMGALRGSDVTPPGAEMARLSDGLSLATLRQPSSPADQPLVAAARPIEVDASGASMATGDPLPAIAVTAPRAAPDRMQVAMQRSARRLHFDAAAWLAHQDGGTTVERLQSAERLLLPVDAISADVGEALAEREAALLVRAALLDPAYQLK